MTNLPALFSAHAPGFAFGFSPDVISSLILSTIQLINQSNQKKKKLKRESPLQNNILFRRV